MRDTDNQLTSKPKSFNAEDAGAASSGRIAELRRENLDLVVKNGSCKSELLHHKA